MINSQCYVQVIRRNCICCCCCCCLFAFCFCIFHLSLNRFFFFFFYCVVVANHRFRQSSHFTFIRKTVTSWTYIFIHITAALEFYFCLVYWLTGRKTSCYLLTDNLSVCVLTGYNYYCCCCVLYLFTRVCV